MGRFNRFLHLEKERPAKADEPPREDARNARFDAVQPSAEPVEQPPTAPERPEHLARFEEKARGAELSLQLKRNEDQPFIRCAECEGDSTRFAHECQHCQADLNTPEQRAFNEALWADRRAQRDQEAVAAAEALEARQQAANEEALQRRAMFEQMARDVRRSTEAGLGGDAGSASFRWRGRSIRFGSPRTELGGAAVVFVLLLVFAGAFGSCRTAASLLPLALIVGGALAVRHLLRSR